MRRFDSTSNEVKNVAQHNTQGWQIDWQKTHETVFMRNECVYLNKIDGRRLNDFENIGNKKTAIIGDVEKSTFFLGDSARCSSFHARVLWSS